MLVLIWWVDFDKCCDIVLFEGYIVPQSSISSIPKTQSMNKKIEQRCSILLLLLILLKNPQQLHAQVKREISWFLGLPHLQRHLCSPRSREICLETPTHGYPKRRVVTGCPIYKQPDTRSLLAPLLSVSCVRLQRENQWKVLYVMHAMREAELWANAKI